MSAERLSLVRLVDALRMRRADLAVSAAACWSRPKAVALAVTSDHRSTSGVRLWIVTCFVFPLGVGRVRAAALLGGAAGAQAVSALTYRPHSGI